MNPASPIDLERLSTAIAQEGRDVFQWEWAESLPRVLTKVDIKDSRRVQGILDKHFHSRWTASTVQRAPSCAAKILERMNGIMTGQALYLGAPGSDPFPFAAWWPWSNGTTFSVRIGYCAGDGSQKTDPSLDARMKEWFGVRDDLEGLLDKLGGPSGA